MKTLEPNVVWMFDDHVDGIRLAQEELAKRDPIRDETLFRGGTTPEEVMWWLRDEASLCDSVLVDIIGGDEQLAWVDEALNGNLPMSKLCEVSGVSLLTWLRHTWPRLPVVMLSAYLSPSKMIALAEVLRSLTRFAVCGLAKSSSYLLPDLLWIAQQSIIGVRISKTLVDAARKVLDVVNECQNHFYFVLCNEEKDLIAPPKCILGVVQQSTDRLRLHEAWNNRVLALLEDIETKPGDNNTTPSVPFLPFLPFGGGTLRRFPMQICREVRNMGEAYLAPYLIRECARAAYSVFFDIKPHPIDTGECLFDDSTHAPDLLPGIERGKICPRCELQMDPPHAFGGWSQGRKGAAAKIAALAKDELSRIK